MKPQFSINLITAAFTMVFAHAQAHAQQDEILPSEISASSAKKSDAEERIRITGTRIKRADFTMPMPIVSLDKAEIEAIGSNELVDALLEIPSITSGVSSEGSTTNVQNAGILTADLRNLGDNRTLVLIDGRRAVSNSANGNRVDLGTIPASFVQRVETVTGGASSIYGSDAVAGVVNIITENNQEGLEINVRGGRTNTYRSADQTFDISWGTSFANSKGYFFSSVNYDIATATRAQNVPRSLIQADFRYDDGINTFVNMLGQRIPSGQITPDQFGDLSADPDGGRFDGSNFWYDDNGLREDFVIDRDGFDFRADDDLRGARDRLNIALKGDYQITDDTDAFFSLIYSRLDTSNQREPEGDDFNDPHLLVDAETFTFENVTAGRIPLTNPFAPQIIIDNESSAGIRWDRRFVEVGNQLTENERTTTRFWAGLRGTVFDDWDWETTVGYGKFEQEQIRFNEINILNLRQGLNAERLADGSVQCIDAAARAAGCVPVNLFGRGSITPEAADYIRANLAQDAEVTQLNLVAFMTGTLFETKAGPINAAFGFEYREDEQDLVPDELNQRGGHSSIHVPAFSGSIDVAEIFAELSVPIFTNVAGLGSLSNDTSFRIADYSIDNVGTVFSFGTGLQWRPVENLNVRASFNRALRAPDLTELFSPPRGDSDTFTDICDGVTLESTGTVAENCRSEPGVLATIIAEGVFEEESPNHSSPNSGNLDLKEEEADTLSIGFVWSPGWLKGFTLATDYYNIDVTDAIDAFSNVDILRQCYEDANTFGDGNPFCQEITRGEEDGQLQNVIQRQFNLDSLETSGIDYSLNYNFDVSAIPGNFTLRYIHTHLIKYEIQANGLDGVIIDDQKGELNHANFEDRGRLSLAWNNEQWRVSWRVNYFSSTIDSRELQEAYDEALLEFPDTAEEPLFLNISDEFFHNLSVAYRTEIKGLDVRFSAGFNNIFDNEGPFVPLGDTESGNARNTTNAFGLRGRYGFASVNVGF